MVTASPDFGFAKPFKTIEKMIFGKYNYKMIPYDESTKHIKNRQSVLFDQRDTHLGDLLFGAHGNHLRRNSRIRGDKQYGNRYW